MVSPDSALLSALMIVRNGADADPSLVSLPMALVHESPDVDVSFTYQSGPEYAGGAVMANVSAVAHVERIIPWSTACTDQ